MKHDSRFRFAIHLSFLLAVLPPVLSGCLANKNNFIPDPPRTSTQTPTPQIDVNGNTQKRNKELREEIGLLQKQLQRQKQLTAQLQLSLLKKHTETDKLLLKNERLIIEFVRNKKQVRNTGNKVETVRLLAEVAAVINMTKENVKNGAPADTIRRAEQYLTEGQAELESENYDGASYLAGQALDLIQSSQWESKNQSNQNDEKEVSFLTHLPMKVLENSNVREEPSMQAKIKFVQKADSSLTATGYKGLWVKVKIKDDEYGWIHYSLLSGAQE